MAEVHYVTSRIGGAGKSHYILRRVSGQEAIYYRIHVAAGDRPHVLPQLLETSGFHLESEERRVLHVDVGAAPPETTAAMLRTLLPLVPRDAIYVEFPSGHPLPTDLPDGHKEVVKDMELDMEEPRMVPREGGGYVISWVPCSHREVAAKFMLAVKGSLFDFKSNTFQINWTLSTAPSLTPAELLQELHDTLSSARDFRVLSAFTRLLGGLVELGESWNILNLRLLQEFDEGWKRFKHFTSLSLMDTARQFAVPRLSRRDLPCAWARRLCKADPGENAIRDKLPLALGGSRFELINAFLCGASVRADVWATLDAALALLLHPRGYVGDCRMLFPEHLDPQQWGSEPVWQTLKANSFAPPTWARTATSADLAACLAAAFGRRGTGAWEAPLQALPGFNNFLAVTCVGYRCQFGVPALLIEREPSGKQSNLVCKAVAELLGYSLLPPLRFEQRSPPEEIVSRLEESVNTAAEGKSLLCVQWAPASTDLAVAGHLKSLFLDGFVGVRQKPPGLVVIGAVVGLDYATAVELLPSSLVQVAWPLHQ